MSNPIQVSASVLCADFTKLGEEIKKCEDSGVDMIHVDVMDGHFVPPITIGEMIVQAIRPLTSLIIDVHMMIDHPNRHIDSFIDAGADIISMHVECFGTLKQGCRELGQYPKEIEVFDVEAARKDVLRIKDKGKKAFMTINPGTELCLGDLEKDLDGVLMMSVNPGFSGQKFNPVALPKIKELRKTFNGDIAIDGGVNAQTAPDAVAAGANILATASYFFGADDPKAAVEFLKSLR